jgi:hypothetical protein
VAIVGPYTTIAWTVGGQPVPSADNQTAMTIDVPSTAPEATYTVQARACNQAPTACITGASTFSLRLTS